MSKGSSRDLFLCTRCLPRTSVVRRTFARRRAAQARHAPGNARTRPALSGTICSGVVPRRLGHRPAQGRLRPVARYRDEAIRVLSDHAPDLQQALERAKGREIDS